MIGQLAAAVGLLGLLTIVPGPDMAVVTRAALSGGRRAAVETAAGVAGGLLVWGLVAVVGLAAVLAASAGAYAGVRLVSAAYLVWLGLSTLWRSRRSATERAWFARPERPDRGGRGGRSGGHGGRTGGGRPGQEWRSGLLTNLLNPKIGVFYTSVLPQLVPTGAPVAATQAGLVLAHAGLSLAWLNGWAGFVGRSGSFARRPEVARRLGRVTGAVLVGLGLEISLRTR